jgi:hypothetical protein
MRAVKMGLQRDLVLLSSSPHRQKCYGTAKARGSYDILHLLEVVLSYDDSSQLEGLWNTTANAVIDTYNAWGWVMPAILLTALFVVVCLLLIGLVSSLHLECFADLSPEVEPISAIFSWTRKEWLSTHGQNEKGTPDLVCLSLKDEI